MVDQLAASKLPQQLVHVLYFPTDGLIGLGRSCDEEDEVELYHMVVMAGVEQTH